MSPSVLDGNDNPAHEAASTETACLSAGMSVSADDVSQTGALERDGRAETISPGQYTRPRKRNRPESMMTDVILSANVQAETTFQITIPSTPATFIVVIPGDPQDKERAGSSLPPTTGVPELAPSLTGRGDIMKAKKAKVVLAEEMKTADHSVTIA